MAEQGLNFFVVLRIVGGGETTKRSPATSSQIELLCSVLVFRPRFSFSAAFGWEKGDFGTCLKYEWINKRERNQMFV